MQHDLNKEERVILTPWLAPVLHDMGVHRIDAFLSGGGDEGQFDDLSFIGEDGSYFRHGHIDDHLSGMYLYDGGNFAMSFLDHLKFQIEAEASTHGNYADGVGGSAQVNMVVDPESGIIVSDVTFCQNDDDYDPEEEDWDGPDEGEGNDMTAGF